MTGKPSPPVARAASAIVAAIAASALIGWAYDIGPLKSKSLGMQLVSTLVRQLDGQLQTVREHGTAFRITFLLEAAS